MPESLKTAFARRILNLFPAFRRTGGRCTYISDDWKEVRLKLPFNWKTKNAVGTMFGGQHVRGGRSRIHDHAHQDPGA